MPAGFARGYPYHREHVFLLRLYFEQHDCTCISQLVLYQLKAFFIGFHEYLQRNPQNCPDEVKSYRVRELFNRFMMLMERDYKKSRDVNYYAEQMNITSSIFRIS